jgi:hypothetical protein
MEQLSGLATARALPGLPHTGEPHGFSRPRRPTQPSSWLSRAATVALGFDRSTKVPRRLSCKVPCRHPRAVEESTSQIVIGANSRGAVRFSSCVHGWLAWWRAWPFSSLQRWLCAGNRSREGTKLSSTSTTRWIDWWHDHPLTAALVSLVRLSIALLAARPVTGRPVWCAASAVSSATQLHAGHETLPLDTNLT